jgi:glycine/serine hydroxymethyltransferase
VSPEGCIIQALRYDHDNVGNARRIVEALAANGYRIVLSAPPGLPEIHRLYTDAERAALIQRQATD